MYNNWIKYIIIIIIIIIITVGFRILWIFFLHCRLGIYSRGRTFNFAHVQELPIDFNTLEMLDLSRPAWNYT